MQKISKIHYESRIRSKNTVNTDDFSYNWRDYRHALLDKAVNPTNDINERINQPKINYERKKVGENGSEGTAQGELYFDHNGSVQQNTDGSPLAVPAYLRVEWFEVAQPPAAEIIAPNAALTNPSFNNAAMSNGWGFSPLTMALSGLGGLGAIGGLVAQQKTTSTNATNTSELPIINIIGPLAVDDIINQQEAGQALTIHGTSNVPAGQTVTVTLNNKDYTTTSNADDTWTVIVPQTDVAQLSSEQNYTITAHVKDPAGQSAVPANHTIGTASSAPQIDITSPIALDDVINEAEAGLDLEVHGTTSAQAGQSVIVHIGDTQYTTTVHSDNTWHITVPHADMAQWQGGQTYPITADVSDIYGNTALQAQHTISVNLAPDAQNDERTVFVNVPLAIDVLGNDTDGEQDELTISNPTQGAHGTVTLQNGQILYTPEDNYTGTDSFTYVITDTVGNTDVATVTLNITDTVQSDPMILEEDIGTDEDTPITISLQGDGPESSPLTIVNHYAPEHGTVHADAQGNLVYVPDPDFTGPDVFMYEAFDAFGGYYNGYVNIVVNPIQDLPDAVDDTISTLEDTPVVVLVLGNDTDIDGDTLSVIATTNGAHGTVALDDNGNPVYTPDANFNGSDSFTYTVSDGHGGTDIATVNITVDAVNDAPIAQDDTTCAATFEDNPVVIHVIRNDSDPEGNPLEVIAVTNGAHGTVTLDASGNPVYTPEPNFNGTDSFTYTISDGHGGTDTATATVVVNPVNDAPVAVFDSVQTDEDTPLTIDVRANDRDVDGDALTVLSWTQGEHGSVALDENGNPVYTPAENFFGMDYFNYTITDGNGATSTATVVVKINSINDAPDAIDDVISVDEDGSVTVPVLTNDTDIDGVCCDDLTVIETTNGAHGTVTLDASGNPVYTPDPNFNGEDSFTYTISDGQGGTDTAVVHVTVNPINDAPDAVDDEVQTDEDTPITINVRGNDTDVEQDPLTVIEFTQGTHGTVTLDDNGNPVYTPDANFNGNDSFTYTISDGHGGTDTAVVNVVINPINDVPDAVNDDVLTDEDTPVTIAVRGNDTDPEQDPLTVIEFTQGTHGTVTLDDNGNPVYTPDANFNGNDSFTYTIIDGNGGTDTAVVNVVINPVNDAPDAVDDAACICLYEDGQVTVRVLNNDSDIDGNSISVIATTNGAHGTVTLDASGNPVYTPDPNYTGSDSFTYTISDGQGGTDTATVTVNVTPVNDLPIAVNDSVYTDEDTPITIEVRGNDSDVDGDALTVIEHSNPEHGTVVMDANGNPVYTPDANYHGMDVFTYTISDSHGGTDTATVVVHIAPVNDAPTALDDDASTLENTPVTIPVRGNDSDIESPVLTVIEVSNGTHGSVTLDANGNPVYNPDANYHGPDSFTYTVVDGDGATATATVVINVISVNSIPTAVDDAAQTPEDTAINIVVLDNDSDIDGDPLSTILVGTAQHGTVQINDDGTVTYTPDANFHGTDSFIYTITDGQGEVASATVTVVVTPVNDDFTDENESTSTNEDTPVNGNLLTGTTSVDGAVSVVNFTVNDITYTVGEIAQFDEGSLTVDSEGNYTFAPAPDFNGTVPQVTYTLTDGLGATEISTLDIAVNPVNDDFTDDDESVSTDEDTAIDGSLLTDTSSVDGALSVVDFTVNGQTYAVGDTAVMDEGSLTVGADGNYTFTPTPDFNGNVPQVTYTLTDGSGATDTSTLDIVVNPTNDDFTDDNEFASTNEDTPVSGNLLTGTSSLDGEVTVVNFTVNDITYTVGDTAEFDEGSLTVGANGNYTFTPATDFNGSVPQVTYTLTDGSGATDTSTLDIVVNPVNDDFTDENESNSTEEDTPVSGNLLIGTSSVDGAVSVVDFTVNGVTHPVGDTVELTEGSLTVGANGNYTFTPATDFNGSVPQVTYTLTDGSGATDTSTLDIVVNPVNDDFTDENESNSTEEDTPVSGNLLIGTSSVDGAVSVVDFTVNGVTHPAGDTVELTEGSLTVDSEGNYTFTPAANFNGTVPQVTYTVTDGSGNNDTSTLDIVVTPVNDDFTDDDESTSTNEDTPISGNLLIDTSSVDGVVTVVNFTVNDVTYTVGDIAEFNEGSLTVDSEGNFTFTPATNFNGNVPQVTYTVSDGSGTDDTSTLGIVVTPVSDAPSFTVDAPVVMTLEDVSVALGLNAPSISDGTQLPERLSAITLSGIPSGVVVRYGATNFTVDGSDITIVLNDAGNHLSDALGGLSMTMAEFEAMSITPTPHSADNFTVTIGVTEYEVDAQGVAIVSGMGTQNSVLVNVLAVTDEVTLSESDAAADFDGATDGVLHVYMSEDTAYNLTPLLQSSIPSDWDGSEQRVVVISNLPDGSTVNGTTVVNGSISVPLSNGTQLPDLIVQPPENFSGDITNVLVTLKAHDTDSDSTHLDADGLGLTDLTNNTIFDSLSSITLNLLVAPVGGDVRIAPVVVIEETAALFLENFALLDEAAGNEVINAMTIDVIPAGWVFSNHDGSVIIVGDGVTGYPIPQADIDSGAYLQYTLLPPDNSSTDANTTLTVTTTDTNTVNGLTISNTQTVSLPIAIVVTPVSETDAGDTNHNGLPDVTLQGTHVYQTHATEDVWFDLAGSEPVILSVSDEDSSELVWMNFSGVGEGAQFKYFDGAQEIILTINDPVAGVDVPVAYLDTVQFKPEPQMSGEVQIITRVKTMDIDEDTGAAALPALSVVSGLLTMTVDPVPDQATVLLTQAKGFEDMPIPLNIKPYSDDPSEVFNVKIDAIPHGSWISYGGEWDILPLIDNGNGTSHALIDHFDATVPLVLHAFFDSNEDMMLMVSAQSLDGAQVGDWGSPLPLTVDVKGVADTPTYQVNSGIFGISETQADDNQGVIGINDFMDYIFTQDFDGSETITVVVTGLRADMDLQGANFISGEGQERRWVLRADQLNLLKVIAPNNFSGIVDLAFKAVVTENDGNVAIGEVVHISFPVIPAPEATMALRTELLEDTLTLVNFDILYQNGDSDETINQVSILKSSLDNTVYTLYYGTEQMTLDDAVSAGAIVDDGTHYVLSGSAIHNIYAQYAADSAGTAQFSVNYVVTDTASDDSGTNSLTVANQTYVLNTTAVTDPTSASVGAISAAGNAAVDETSNTVVFTERTVVDALIHIEQVDNATENGGVPNGFDVDGSEQLHYFIIDGVPEGVTIEGATYLGNIAGAAHTGQWMIALSAQYFLSFSFDYVIRFHIAGTAEQLNAINNALISIQVVSGDQGAANTYTANTSWTLSKEPSVTMTNDTHSAQAPATIEAISNTVVPDMMEDTMMSLSQLTSMHISGSSDYSITLTGVPAGTAVGGMRVSTVNGTTVYTVSGTGSDTDLQATLSAIDITAPSNSNDNQVSEGLQFDVTLTTYSATGEHTSMSTHVTQSVLPVSDTTAVGVMVANVLEDGSQVFHINLGNIADGAWSILIEGKLYVQISDGDTDGVLTYNGAVLVKQTISGVLGLTDGAYYVIEGVSNNSSYELQYTPALHITGEVSLQAFVSSMEANASEVLWSQGVGTFEVMPIANGLPLSATVFASGDEDTRIPVVLDGLMVDASETILNVVLGNLPLDYLVYFGDTPETAVMADNLGTNSAGSNDWFISVNHSVLPNIYVLPPKNISGDVADLVLNVLSRDGAQTIVQSYGFALTVNAVSDAVTINPTTTFGGAFMPVSLNLNANAVDLDGSEHANITLTGQGWDLSAHGRFVIERADGSTQTVLCTFDSATHTWQLADVPVMDLGHVMMYLPAGSGMVDVAITMIDGVAPAANTVTSQFMLNVTGASAIDTSSLGAHNDTIYGGSGNETINTGAGNDYINAGAGNNVLTGGDGNDVFDFAQFDLPNSTQHITDFTSSADTLVLSHLVNFDAASVDISQEGVDVVMILNNDAAQIVIDNHVLSDLGLVAGTLASQSQPTWLQLLPDAYPVI